MDTTRRCFLKQVAGGAISLGLCSTVRAKDKPNAKRPNILLITADDMNCDSVGAYGCKTPEITPNDTLTGSWGRSGTPHRKLRSSGT